MQRGYSWVVRAGYGMIFFEQTGITTPFTLPLFPFIQTVGQQSPDAQQKPFWQCALWQSLFSLHSEPSGRSGVQISAWGSPARAPPASWPFRELMAEEHTHDHFTNCYY